MQAKSVARRSTFTLLALVTVLVTFSGSQVYQSWRPSLREKTEIYDPALAMINSRAFVDAGLTGKDVKIGIIDVGFHKADESPFLTHVFSGKQILGTRDFVNTDNDSTYGARTKMDWHGTSVWKFIAGAKQEDHSQYGLATDAKFYLARTDNGEQEFRKEQEYFKEAIEWLHSKGVRLVHASIGYGIGFTDPAENYVPNEMDGKSTLISQVVQEMILKKNMILVNSAGNEGGNPWKIITSPSDAEHVISVGATDEKLVKREYSSEGPEFLPYLKPDISVHNSASGTSFAAPVVTGIVACMLQKDSTLTSKEIMDIMKRSGHLYPYGNNYLGYGIPDAGRILKLMNNREVDFKRTRKIEAKGQEVSLDLGGKGELITLFHKKDQWIVLKQEKMNGAGGKLTVSRPGKISRSKLVVDDKLQAKFHLDTTDETVARTTVATKDKVVEIVWQ